MTWGILTLDDPKESIEYIEHFACLAKIELLIHLTDQAADLYKSYKDQCEEKATEAMKYMVKLLDMIYCRELDSLRINLDFASLVDVREDFDNHVEKEE